ncbi:hypothetical protein AB6A40_004965 [Gnathostoma spinigerum]|uniref:Alpha-1,3/1,6-mannosyltransferase ALG2 n=1 Tax=Gnathostoma spinigerum TaxID=75299 RepID=A0ABD6EGD2_9BILA
MLITFIHPDLGIGGAERLVIDSALAAIKNGHQVEIVTNHFSYDHCFEEAKSLNVKVVDVFPRSVFGRMMALCAYIRMCIAAFYVCLFRSQTDLIFCDSISACLVVCRLFRLFHLIHANLFFYCHFPDRLLTDRKSTLKTIYRYLVDGMEEWTTGMADLICVNSNFTKKVVYQTFPSLKDRKLEVLYPTLNTKFFDESPRIHIDDIPESAKYIFVSLNRFENKKNVDLAINAFAELKNILTTSEYERCFLVIAGGFDKRNAENLICFHKLRELAVEVQIPSRQIIFLRSPNDSTKVELLRRATAVLYTPENEHFGIVPIEAMYMKTCVIATNTGGPKESIEDGVTGFLVDSVSALFAEKMALLVKGEVSSEEMGKSGNLRVQQMFTFKVFCERLEKLFESLRAS